MSTQTFLFALLALAFAIVDLTIATTLRQRAPSQSELAAIIAVAISQGTLVSIWAVFGKAWIFARFMALIATSLIVVPPLGHVPGVEPFATALFFAAAMVVELGLARLIGLRMAIEDELATSDPEEAPRSQFRIIDCLGAMTVLAMAAALLVRTDSSLWAEALAVGLALAFAQTGLVIIVLLEQRDSGALLKPFLVALAIIGFVGCASIWRYEVRLDARSVALLGFGLLALVGPLVVLRVAGVRFQFHRAPLVAAPAVVESNVAKPPTVLAEDLALPVQESGAAPSV